MKIKYIVNGVSKTSVPKRWSDYINREEFGMRVDMVVINEQIKLLFKREKEEYIAHGHHIKAMALFLLFNLFLRKKTIYTLHGSYQFLSKTNKILLSFIFNYVERIVFVNRVVYDELPKDIKVKIANRCDIILNGIEKSYIYNKIDVYKKFKINESDETIFHPARFVREKNHLNLIDAMKTVVEHNSKAKLLLAGSGELEDEIRNRVRELNLGDSVVFLGLISRDEVYCFLERCDLFVMPSISEGLNIAFLEAVSMKSKVLVSDIESFRYPFVHYNIDAREFNIRFVNPKDSSLIAKGIEESLKKEKNIDFDFSKFSLKNMVLEYQKIYKR